MTLELMTLELHYPTNWAYDGEVEVLFLDGNGETSYGRLRAFGRKSCHSPHVTAATRHQQHMAAATGLEEIAPAQARFFRHMLDACGGATFAAQALAGRDDVARDLSEPPMGGARGVLARAAHDHCGQAA